MTRTLLNRTTATRENALTDAERDAFLSELRIGRLSTNREDGWAHVTPIWYVWEDGRFLLTLGKSRRHLRNIARDPHVTLCVDEDPRRPICRSHRARSSASVWPRSSRRRTRSVRRRARSSVAICRPRRGDRSSTSCSGSRGGPWSKSPRSAGSRGTRARASAYSSIVMVVSCGVAARTSTAPPFGTTRRSSEKWTGLLPNGYGASLTRHGPTGSSR
jgi:hypothetical protein